MKVDSKIFYISLFLLLFFSVGFYLLVPDFAMKYFNSLEQNNSINEAGKMRYSITQEIDNLSDINNRWSNSNDLSSFFISSTEGRDSLITNFDFESIKELEIDYLALFDEKGSLLYSIEINNGVVYSKSFERFLIEPCSKLSGDCAGLARFEQGEDIAAISRNSIMGINGSSAIGYVVMAKILDKTVLMYDGKEMYLGIIDSILKKKISLSNSAILEDKISNSTLDIYSFYNDVAGESVFYSKISTNRDSYQMGKSIVNAISYSFLVSQLLMVLSFLLVTKRMILTRLNLLIMSMRLIENNKNAEIITFDGDDEIAVLSREIKHKLNGRKFNSTKSNLNIILKSMRDIIIILDGKNHIISSHFPVRDSEKIKKIEKEVFLSNEFLLEIIETISSTRDRSHSVFMEYPILIGRKRNWYDINICTRKTDNGSFDGTTIVIRDNTYSKKMQEDMQEKIMELQKLNKLMVGRELKMIELKKKISQIEKNEKKDKRY